MENVLKNAETMRNRLSPILAFVFATNLVPQERDPGQIVHLTIVNASVFLSGQTAD